MQSIRHRYVRSSVMSFVAVLFATSCQWAAAAEYVAGRHYFGENKYIEYIAGDAPVIITAPHAGNLTPAAMPDRTYGTLVTDRNIDRLVLAFAKSFHEMTGRYPHVVLCHLKRTKLDANRDIEEAAQGNALAEQAWREWHAFIDAAKEAAVEQYGCGLYIDVHGHGHAAQRLEFGYNITGKHLQLSDAEIVRHRDRSSLRALAETADTEFAALLRGPASFGALIAARGFPSVPSPEFPDPNGLPYFSGGPNTRRHACGADNRISGFQLECNFKGVRDTEANRKRAAAALAESAIIYLKTHYGIDMKRTEEVLTAASTN